MHKNLALVFPGQGSQALGMLDPFIADNPEIVANTCAEASKVLGYDVAQLIKEGPQEQLNQTIYTQPLLLTAGVAAFRIWQSLHGEQPVILAGHSLGEYTALVCAGALSFAEGLGLVAKRAELMQNAVPTGQGAMAAILGLELSQIKQICANVDAQAANINAPGQIVVAGTTEAVNLVMARAKDLGAKRAILLPVSVPSHCMLMEGAALELGKTLQTINWQIPAIDVLHNYDVAMHKDAAGICNALQQQLFNPVRWVESIEYMMQHGITEIVECGPGKILTGLNKRIAPQLNCRALSEGLQLNLC